MGEEEPAASLPLAATAGGETDEEGGGEAEGVCDAEAGAGGSGKAVEAALGADRLGGDDGGEEVKVWGEGAGADGIVAGEEKMGEDEDARNSASIEGAREKQLEGDLKKAIAEERYEDAARLRDELKNLERDIMASVLDALIHGVEREGHEGEEEGGAGAVAGAAREEEIRSVLDEVITQVEVIAKVVEQQLQQMAEEEEVEAEADGEVTRVLAGMLADSGLARPRMKLPPAPTPAECDEEVRARLAAEEDARILAEVEEAMETLKSQVEVEVSTQAAVDEVMVWLTGSLAAEEAERVAEDAFASAEERVTADKQFEVLEEVLGQEADAVAAEEAAAAQAAAELLEHVLEEEVREAAMLRVAWAREAAALSRELEAASELQAARRAAVLRVAKGKLSKVHAEVVEQEGRVRLMHGIMQHLDLNLEIATSLQDNHASVPRERASLEPPAPSGITPLPLHPDRPGSLTRSLLPRAAVYECVHALAALEDERTAAAAALRTSQYALDSKSARLASLKTHLSAVKQHLKGIDPKLVKAAAEGYTPTSKEGLTALLRDVPARPLNPKT